MKKCYIAFVALSLLLSFPISLAQGMVVIEKILEHKIYLENGKIVHYLKNCWKDELKNITIEDYVNDRFEKKLTIPLLKPGEVKNLTYKISQTGKLKSLVSYFLYREKHTLIPQTLEINETEMKMYKNFNPLQIFYLVLSLAFVLILVYVLKVKKT